MQTTLFQIAWAFAGGSLLALSSGCAGRVWQRETSGDRSAETARAEEVRPGQEGESKDPRAPTMLWVHGTANADDTVRIGAKGARTIVNARHASRAQLLNVLGEFARRDVGICLTIRWQNPTDEKNPQDEAPTDDEGRRVADELIEILNSADAKALSGRIWVQFFNEITGGPGRFAPDQADRMFEWATATAIRLRAEAPHVKIAGPAITGAEVLESDEKDLRGMSRVRHDGMLRAIRWSVKYADAVDVHLHVRDATAARSRLNSVRRLMDREEGGRQTGIVVWEWSCAKFPDRESERAVRAAIIGIWKEMAAAGVLHAAYGGMWVPRGQPEVYQWKNLHGPDGKPNEPFYTTFRDIAAGRTEEDVDRR